MSAKFFFPNPNNPGDWDLGDDGILVPRDGYFAGNVQMKTANGGPLSGMRNRLRNSRGRIATRGTSVVIPGSGGMGLDGWNFTQFGGGVMTMSQSTDLPAVAGLNIPFSIRCTVSTADAAMAATDVYVLRHIIEGYEVQDLVGNPIMIGFWVRSPKTGVHSLNLTNSSADRWYVATYTVNAANTWEWKTVFVGGGLDTSAGTWNFTNGIGLYCQWVVACGSNYFNGSVGAWNATVAGASSSQVNAMDTVGNIFAIAGPRLERCTSMQPGYEEFEPITWDRLRNMEYLQALSPSAAGQALTTTAALFAYPIEVPMRGAPSLIPLNNSPLITVPGLGTASIAGTWALSNGNGLGVGVQFTRSAGTWTQGNALNVNENTPCLLLSAEL